MHRAGQGSRLSRPWEGSTSCQLVVLKLLGAAGAAALTVGAMSAAPAVAAPITVTYSCFGGQLAVPITMDLGTLPTTLVAGQTVKQTITSGNVHLIADADRRRAAQTWDQVSGTNVGDLGHAVLADASRRPRCLRRPGASLDIPATGTFTIRPTKAGTFTVKAGDSNADIQGWKAGVKANDIPLDCVAPTDGSNVFGTIAVTKDKSKTTTKASYNAKKDVATGTAKVAGSKFGSPAPAR